MSDTDPYDGLLKQQLEDLVSERNDARGDGDVFVDVAGNGTVADLKAALLADDERLTAATQASGDGPPGPVAIDDVRAAEVRAAEASAQRSVCVIPDGDFPQDLQDALDRRVVVNLASTDPNRPVTRVGGRDPEVRRLEASYRRRRAAGS